MTKTNPYKDLCDKEYEDIDYLKSDLHNNFFPDCEFIYEAPYEEGAYKYTWDNFLIIKYFNEYYKLKIESRGNGGWQSMNECKVTSVTKTERKAIVTTEYIWVDK